MPEVWHRIFGEARLGLKYLSEQHYAGKGEAFLFALSRPE
jgi:hypothetical protein